MKRIIERLKTDIEMRLRYLRHDRYDVVYDYWIAAVRKSAVWIFAAIEYSKTPVVLEGMRPSKDIGGPGYWKDVAIERILAFHW